MTEAYPLQWPAAYKRTRYPQSSRFGSTFASARDGIIDEIRLMGGRNPIISTNIPLRRDGLPYASLRAPDDKGVAVYFTYNKNQVVLACDRWDDVTDNMQAIRKTIEAMRGMDRWGVSDMLNRMFTGFKALPENAGGNTWWEVLGVTKDADVGEIKLAYHALAKRYHPDINRSNPKYFTVVKAAYEQAMALFTVNV